VIVLGHGSPLKGFDSDMRKVVKELAKKESGPLVVAAFLGSQKPSLEETIDTLVKKKIAKIFVLPYFLLKGRHTQMHIPEIVNNSAKKYKNKSSIVLCDYIGYDSRLVDILKTRIQQTPCR